MGIPFDDAYVRLAEIGDKMKMERKAMEAVVEAAKLAAKQAEEDENKSVSVINIDGREWETVEDEAIAKKIQESLSTLVESLGQQAESLKQDMENIKNGTDLSNSYSAKKLEEKENELQDVNMMKKYIANVNKILSEMGSKADKTKYSFKELGKNATIGYLSLPEEGKIVMNYVGGVYSFANQVHETVHAAQYKRGAFRRSTGKDSKKPFAIPLGMKDYLEMEAYRVQYLISSESMPHSRRGTINSLQDIDKKWLKGIQGYNSD